MKNSPTNGFGKLPFAALLAKATFIKTQIAAHPLVFATPVPALTVLEDKIDAFAGTMAEAEAGNKVAKGLRREAKKDLIACMRQMGLYVAMIANENPIVVEQGGYDPAKPALPLPPIQSVATPVLKPGPNADIIAKTGSIDGVKTYNFYITTNAAAPMAEWVVRESTKTSCHIKDTLPATRYHVMVGAVGTNDQKVFSGVATIVTQ